MGSVLDCPRLPLGEAPKVLCRLPLRTPRPKGGEGNRGHYRRMRFPEHSNPEIATPAPARVFAWLGWLALSCCCLAGCGRGPRAAAAPPAGSGTHAAPAAKAVEIQEDPVKTGIESADAALASKVRSGFAADPRLRQLPIEMDAEAGRVTLWGRVDRAEQRAAAEQQARRTPGVTSIVNLIKVGG